MFGNSLPRREPRRKPPEPRHVVGHIPRLRVVFGLLKGFLGDERKAVEFLRHFAAVDLSIPEGRMVDRFIRDVLIVRSLEKDDSKPAKRRIAELYGVRYKDLARILRERAETN